MGKAQWRIIQLFTDPNRPPQLLRRLAASEWQQASLHTLDVPMAASPRWARLRCAKVGILLFGVTDNYTMMTKALEIKRYSRHSSTEIVRELEGRTGTQTQFEQLSLSLSHNLAEAV